TSRQRKPVETGLIWRVCCGFTTTLRITKQLPDLSIEKSAEGVARVLGAHERLAHEEGVDAAAAQDLHIAPACDSAFRPDDAVGPHRARLEHLVRLDAEILAQRRQPAGGAGSRQVLGRALEEPHVSKH